MPACLLNDPSRTPFQANPFGWATAVPNARYSCKLRARATEVLVRPGKIIGVGRNYVEHAAELGNAVPERPLLFFKPPTAVIGDGDPIVRPPGASQMAFGIVALVAYVSQAMTLEPGDLIATGTPAGVGPLQPGDVVEVEIPGVGVLRNPVVA